MNAECVFEQLVNVILLIRNAKVVSLIPVIATFQCYCNFRVSPYHSNFYRQVLAIYLPISHFKSAS